MRPWGILVGLILAGLVQSGQLASWQGWVVDSGSSACGGAAPGTQRTGGGLSMSSADRLMSLNCISAFLLSEGTIADRLHSRSGSQRPVQLMVRGARAPKDALTVRIDLWNTTAANQLVAPIDPALYRIEFRVKGGASSQVYKRPRAEPRIRSADEMTYLAPGNCLSAAYVLDGFYRMRSNMHGVEYRVVALVPHRMAGEAGKPRLFAVASAWSEVPS